MALVQVSTLGGEGAAPGVTAAASQTNGMTPRWQVVAGSFAAISVAWLVSIAINATFKPPALVIPAGRAGDDNDLGSLAHDEEEEEEGCDEHRGRSDQHVRLRVRGHVRIR